MAVGVNHSRPFLHLFAGIRFARHEFVEIKPCIAQAQQMKLSVRGVPDRGLAEEPAALVRRFGDEFLHPCVCRFQRGLRQFFDVVGACGEDNRVERVFVGVIRQFPAGCMAVDQVAGENLLPPRRGNGQFECRDPILPRAAAVRRFVGDVGKPVRREGVPLHRRRGALSRLGDVNGNGCPVVRQRYECLARILVVVGHNFHGEVFPAAGSDFLCGAPLRRAFDAPVAVR